MKTHTSLNQLDEILDKTTLALEDGKSEIFDLSEKAHKDIMTIEEEYIQIQAKIKVIILEVDRLEEEEKSSRQELGKVSKAYTTFTDVQVRAAYDKAKNLQLRLAEKKQEEKELFLKRSALEARLKDAREVRQRADKLTSKVGAALEYLRNSVLEQIEDIKTQKDISMKIIQAQENERQRMAHEIHDGPAQTMANVVVKAEFCEKLLDIDQDRAKSELRVLKSTVRDSLKSIRKIIYDLMPMSLDDLGLVPTIQNLISDLEVNTGAQVHFQHQVTGELKDPMVVRTVFRIVQEGFNNIVKHASASEVLLKLHIHSDEVNVLIEDNGRGFDPNERTIHNNVDGGFGLYSIRERVDLLEGEFNVQSSIDNGTILTALIPLKDGEVHLNG